MKRPQVSLPAYRRLAAATMVFAVAATVAGLYAALHRQWALALLGLVGGALLLYPSQFVRIRAEPGGEHLLYFVTKAECALCDEARALLPPLLAGTPFGIREIRVETDRGLRRRFGHAVPVLLWQGEVLARLGWDAALLRRRLEDLARAHPPAPPTPPDEAPT